MTFFAHQDRARQNTQKLVGLYCLAVICIILSIYVALLFTSWGMTFNKARHQIHSYGSPGVEQVGTENVTPLRRPVRTIDPQTGSPTTIHVEEGAVLKGSKQSRSAWNSQTLSWWQPQLFWLATLPTLLVIGGASFFRLQALKQGGAVVAQDLGGRLLLPEMAHSPQEQQLINVVEEMAIAAAIPVPFVYILDSESGINAFAAGYSPKNAVIGITRGGLEQLNREELQGVIGHEMSHILNGDMKLNAQLIGALHGILFVYLFGRVLSYVRSRDSNAIMYLGFALMAIGGIGHFFGRLIQSAVSRQREFLADASAVQFTRNPEGIAGALSKIEGNLYRSYVHAPYAEEMSHLFFGTAFNSNWFADWFATHPPIRQRIQKVESYWQRNASRFSAPRTSTPVRSQPQSSMAMGFAGAVAASTPESTSDYAVETTQLQSSKRLSSPPGWLSQVPESLRHIQDEQTAVSLIYALLLESQNPAVRTIQENGLRKVEASLVDTVLQLSSDIDQLEPKLRLLLVDSVIPILLQSSVERCQQVLKTVQALAKADGHWSISEFALYSILWERLQVVLAPAGQATLAVSQEQIWSDCLLVLSAIAQAGANNSEAVIYAFRSGAYQLPAAKQYPIPPGPVAFRLSDLRQSFDRLKQADTKLKRSLMDSCSYTVMLDNQITQSETELLWAIAIILGCPLPSFLKAGTTPAKVKGRVPMQL